MAVGPLPRRGGIVGLFEHVFVGVSFSAAIPSVRGVRSNQEDFDLVLPATITIR